MTEMLKSGERMRAKHQALSLCLDALHITTPLDEIIALQAAIGDLLQAYREEIGFLKVDQDNLFEEVRKLEEIVYGS